MTTYKDTSHTPKFQRNKIYPVVKYAHVAQASKQMYKKPASSEYKQHLVQGSLKVKNESMAVNAEFSQIEHEPKD